MKIRQAAIQLALVFALAAAAVNAAKKKSHASLRREIPSSDSSSKKDGPEQFKSGKEVPQLSAGLVQDATAGHVVGAALPVNGGGFFDDTGSLAATTIGHSRKLMAGEGRVFSHSMKKMKKYKNKTKGYPKGMKRGNGKGSKQGPRPRPSNFRSWMVPELYAGLNRNPTTGIVEATALPVRKLQAEEQGWTLNGDTGKWGSPDFPRLQLRFTRDHVSGISINAPPSPDFGSDYYTAQGIEMTFIDPDNSRAFKLLANGVSYPSTAKLAEQEGWYEGGCKGNMGGSHFYQARRGAWADRGPIDPIYNKYDANATADGDLTSVLLYFGTFVGGGNGFDLGGAFTFKNSVYCYNNYCADQNCLSEIPDRSFENATQTIHIMFNNPLTPVQCQVPKCDDLSCQCCGAEGSQSCIPAGFNPLVFPS